jgi:hypothetical protein
MIIKPETRKLWEGASNRYRSGEEMLKNGNLQKAADEISMSFLCAYCAIMGLSEELKMPDMLVIATDGLSDFCKMNLMEIRYSPQEKIECSRKSLKLLFEQLPPDTLIPFSI